MNFSFKAILNKENFGFIISSFFFLMTICFGICLEQLWLIYIPSLILVGYLLTFNFKLIYWILIASIPFSMTLDFSHRLSTDFPTEFLSILLTSIFWIYFIIHKPKDLNYLWNHKLFWALGIIWIWSLISALGAENKLISVKYSLAKIWFITSYLIFTFWVIRELKDIRKLFWIIFIPLMLTVIWSFIRTVLGGFSFEETNQFSLPFYDNHVIYASTMALFLPFIFIARYWYPRGSVVRMILNFSIFFFLIAIYFSYTRACYLALIVGFGTLILIRRKWLVKTFCLVILTVFLALLFFSKDYFYLRFSPDYNTTVMHEDFKDHVVSTFYGKDASSMERLNMWVSVFRMYQERPWLGYGPNNFPSTYKPYSVMYFKTWVSDNPLQLSCHNYFWLLLAEQGVIGVILFLGFLILILYYLQSSYLLGSSTSIRNQADYRRIILAITASLGILLVLLFFNDLIETSKNGSLFFIFIALLIRVQQLVSIDGK